MDLSQLDDFFHPNDLEWRIQSTNGSWAQVVPYVTNRAIQKRLDEVVGKANWKNVFKSGPGGGVLCGIALRLEADWVVKYDGAENTNIEAVKGGLSGAMKRAAVQWGIGRYLYDMELPQWAFLWDLGLHYQGRDRNGKYDAFNWSPPSISPEFLPEGVLSHPDAIAFIDKNLDATGEVRIRGKWYALEDLVDWPEIEQDYYLALDVVEAIAG